MPTRHKAGEVNSILLIDDYERLWSRNVQRLLTLTQWKGDKSTRKLFCHSLFTHRAEPPIVKVYIEITTSYLSVPSIQSAAWWIVSLRVPGELNKP